jgi:hypothetical protein
MTSLTPIRTEPPSATGRSVRDIVETSPELVNEVWCRKIFRQILQSLELQYAMQMPHRAITPDTVVFHENGEPLLVPALVGEPAHTEAEDLYALAAIVHYAITREPVPAGPLRGRALEGYSESLVTAVDRCLAPDPAQRPRTIDELRDILGIVSLGPPTGAQFSTVRMGAPKMAAARPAADAALPDGVLPNGIPSFMQGAAPAARGLGLGRWQRWALAVGGGAALAAIALVMFAELRDSGSYDHIVLTLPQTADHAREGNGRDALLAGAPARAQDPAPSSIGANGSGATASGQDGAPGATLPQAGAGLQAQQEAAPPPVDARLPAPLPAPLPAAGRHAPATQTAANAVPASGASYRLRVQPWGVVYVDGVDRGVSPPVKRLALAPGRHMLRFTNPTYQDRVLEVDTGNGDGVIAVDFNDEAR